MTCELDEQEYLAQEQAAGINMLRSASLFLFGVVDLVAIAAAVRAVWSFL